MRNLYALTKKDFDTPLGLVETDRPFVARVASRMSATPAGKELNLYADELAHRQEHSIEFQAVFLQYLLGGKRPFKIVPILVGSFHEFLEQNVSPSASPEVSALVEAVRTTAAEHGGRVCYVSSGDLAHIGQRFGDPAFLDAARLEQQAARRPRAHGRGVPPRCRRVLSAAGGQSGPQIACADCRPPTRCWPRPGRRGASYCATTRRSSSTARAASALPARRSMTSSDTRRRCIRAWFIGESHSQLSLARGLL